jgi:hypothetical protein
MRRSVPIALVLLAAGSLAAWLLARPDHRGRQPADRVDRVDRVGRQPADRVDRVDRVVLANEDGRWTVFTRCIPGIVGPGYVARVETADGHVVVDDAIGPGTLNDTDFGGLGAFGWHHSRGLPGRLRFDANNAWEISTRTCARENGGFGVAATRVLERTNTSLTVEVDLGDGYTQPAPLMRVRYRYDLEPDALRSEVTVVELCAGGRCGRTRELAFLKEPKLVAHAGATYDWVDVLDGGGLPVCSSGANGPIDGPILRTTQCDDPARTTVRFSPCRPACLDVETNGWAGRADGFDGWAVDASARPAAFAVDTPSIDGVLWPCHGGDPGGPMMRRWELAGRRGRSIGALLAAWEGGRGGYDCEPLARTFGPRGTTWRAVLSYSLVR